jgi:hypothetical protein
VDGGVVEFLEALDGIPQLLLVPVLDLGKSEVASQVLDLDDIGFIFLFDLLLDLEVFNIDYLVDLVYLFQSSLSHFLHAV